MRMKPKTGQSTKLKNTVSLAVMIEMTVTEKRSNMYQDRLTGQDLSTERENNGFKTKQVFRVQGIPEMKMESSTYQASWTEQMLNSEKENSGYRIELKRQQIR